MDDRNGILPLGGASVDSRPQRCRGPTQELVQVVRSFQRDGGGEGHAPGHRRDLPHVGGLERWARVLPCRRHGDTRREPSRGYTTGVSPGDDRA